MLTLSNHLILMAITDGSQQPIPIQPPQDTTPEIQLNLHINEASSPVTEPIPTIPQITMNEVTSSTTEETSSAGTTNPFAPDIPNVNFLGSPPVTEAKEPISEGINQSTEPVINLEMNDTPQIAVINNPETERLAKEDALVQETKQEEIKQTPSEPSVPTETPNTNPVAPVEATISPQMDISTELPTPEIRANFVPTPQDPMQTSSLIAEKEIRIQEPVIAPTPVTQPTVIAQNIPQMSLADDMKIIQNISTPQATVIPPPAPQEQTVMPAPQVTTTLNLDTLLQDIPEPHTPNLETNTP